MQAMKHRSDRLNPRIGAQVYETQTELTEAREELELTKLKLDVAEQEAEAAKPHAAAALPAQDRPDLYSMLSALTCCTGVCDSD